MGIAKHLYKPLLALFFIGVSPVMAQDSPKPLHFIGRYEFSWNGIALGVLVLGMDETEHTYNLHLNVASEGIVNLFTRHTDDTVASGTRAGGDYAPRIYESHYQTKKKPRHIKLVFDKKGAVAEEINEPPEDPRFRPVVPHALKDGSYDPLSGLLVVRASHQRSRIFDAKRLFAVTAERKDNSTLYLYDGPHKAQAYSLTRIPLAGLTDKETKEFARGEPALTLYFSDDARRIPLAVSVPLYLGHVRGVLIKECAVWEACLK